MKKIMLSFLAFVIAISSFAQEEDDDIRRIFEVYNFIDQLYGDTVDNEKISEAAVVAMLEELDPHSVYIPAKEAQRANEQIDGSFVGVGIRFNILKDTLLVVNTIPGGPSEKVGIQAGDRILKVEDELIAGVGLKNPDVREKLLGEKGSKVEVTVLRGKNTSIYTITRDKIPMNSVVSSYMVDDEVGYIKLSSYTRNSSDEMDEALKKLKKQGMKDLIFDLQGNGGGLLFAAKDIVDKFLKKEKLIVYSEGRKQPRRDLVTSKKRNIEKGRLVILIDESSASASEITAGAVQDWDRGLIVGRRSFGKGLVQRPINLSDGGQVRLTIAKYFTPSGRWIQKPYEDIEDYRNDYINRYKHGEFMHLDSIHLDTNHIYYTLLNKRKVYGGGGIMPDVFVPLDTMEFTSMYKELNRAGLFNMFCLEYANQHRKALEKRYKNLDQFIDGFEVDQPFLDEFFAYAKEEKESFSFDEEDFKISEEIITLRLKATLARDLWDMEAFYQIYNVKNEIFMKGYESLKDGTYDALELHNN